MLGCSHHSSKDDIISALYNVVDTGYGADGNPFISVNHIWCGQHIVLNLTQNEHMARINQIVMTVQIPVKYEFSTGTSVSISTKESTIYYEPILDRSKSVLIYPGITAMAKYRVNQRHYLIGEQTLHKMTASDVLKLAVATNSGNIEGICSPDISWSHRYEHTAGIEGMKLFLDLVNGISD